MKYNLSYHRINSFSIVVFFISSLLLLKFEDGYIRYFLNLTLVSPALLMLSVHRFNRNTISFFVLFLLIFIASYLVSSVYMSNFHVSLFLSFTSCLIFSFIIVYSDKRIDYLFLLYRISFISLCFLLAWLMLGNDPEELFAGSRNTISLLLIGVSAIFLIDKEFHSRLKYGFVFYTLVFVVCVLSMGRSGIISSSVLLFSYCLLVYKKNIFCFLFFNVSAFIVIFLFISGNLIALIGDVEYFSYILSKGVADDYRSNMIREYFYEFTFVSFILGQDISELKYIMSFNGNPHNSYLFYHYNFGFFYLIILMSVLMYFFRLILNFSFISVFALLAVLLRLFTDSVSDISILSFLFSFMMFYKKPRLYFNH